MIENGQEGYDQLKNLVSEIYNESIVQKQYNEDIYIDFNPSLSLSSTLPNNFMNFLVKTGPVAQMENLVNNIIFWRRPQQTMITMAIFTILCKSNAHIIFKMCILSNLNVNISFYRYEAPAYNYNAKPHYDHLHTSAVCR